MTRAQLPHRRPNATREVEDGGHRFTVTIGFDLEGRPKEVFADGLKIGTGLGHVIADACIWASLLLQHGATPADLGKSLTRIPVAPWQGDGTTAASVLGTIAEVVQAEADGIADIVP